MSAYLCDQDTINAIATYAADHKLVADAKLLADLLTLQNVASMKARYPGREWLKAEVIDVAKAYRYERVEVPAARMVNAADEYDYQACETDDYEDTLCAKLIKRVSDHARKLAELERPGGVGAAVYWTARSVSKKTGPIPVSTTSAETCPSACPLAKGGCYAKGGNVGILWHALTRHGPNAAWRHGASLARSIGRGYASAWRGCLRARSGATTRPVTCRIVASVSPCGRSLSLCARTAVGAGLPTPITT